MGALYLKQLDDSMEKTGLFYVRFMDDWIIIAPTRWKLRSAIRIVNKVLNVLKVDKHPDKTFIGKVERGFDFLGYFLKPKKLIIALSTLKGFATRITQLYGQGADCIRIGKYVKHWLKWVRAGIGGAVIMKGKECIKKHPHPSVYEECRCLYNESKLVNKHLAFIHFSLFSSASYLRAC
jgi:hypothetical protein